MTNEMKTAQEIRLAENLKKLMQAKRETIASTAKQVKMNKSSLHNYCNGVIPKNLMVLKALAEFFDVSLGELVFGRPTDSTSLYSQIGIEGRFEVTIRRIED